MLEDRSARYMGVTLTGAVEMTLLNVDSTQVTAHSVQVHPQKPEMGRRVMRRFHKVLIDQIDAATFKVCSRLPLLGLRGLPLRGLKYTFHLSGRRGSDSAAVGQCEVDGYQGGP